MTQRSSAVGSQLLGDFSEADLNKLQLLYRRADANMQAYTEKTQGLIRKDRQEIQRLQNEQDELLRNLKACQTPQADVSVVQDLTAMLACGDRIDEKINVEKVKAASLKKKILKLSTCHSWKADKCNVLNNTCQTENKLYMGRRCFSELMIRNGQLREELTILHTQKKQFLHVQSHLEKELHEIRKDIHKLMTKCNEACNARVKSQERVRLLMDQKAKDVSQYIKERSNLELEMAHYCNFGAFLCIKGCARINQDIDNRKVEKCKKHGSMEDFEDVINKILRETGECDLDRLIKNFIQMEVRIYTLQNFVNCQHSDAEAIQRQLSQLCSEREIFTANQQQQQALLLKVSTKQEATVQQLELCQQRVVYLEKLLLQLVEGVVSLLQIACYSSVIYQQLGSSDGVQEDNIAEYLRIVEDKVSELLTLKSYLHLQETESQWDIDTLNTIDGQLLGITPPSVSLTTAAPDDDPDSLDSVLVGAVYPVNREDLSGQ